MNNDNKKVKNDQERNIVNINNQYNNNINNNFFTIDASRTNSKSKKKIISKKNCSKNLKLKEQIKNFNEKIIYNNYINLHFNNFSSNKNNNNINIISSRESGSLNKKISNNKHDSNITKKIKPKINIKKKQISKIKKNIIVKSSSMKMMQNNKNILDYILSLNKGEANTKKVIKKNIMKLKKDVIKNYENKSDIVSSKKDQKSPKIKSFQINNKKTNLLMDIINNNNLKNIKINKNKIIKNKTYANRIGKSHSSLGFFNTEKISSIQKKNNSNSKLSKTNRTHLSMHNISNSNDYYYNLIDKNYNNANGHSNYSRTKPKKSIRLIYSNKNMNTFLSMNYTTNKKNKKIKEIKSSNSRKLSSMDSKTNDKNSIKNSFDYVNNKKVKKFIHKNNSISKRNDDKNKHRYNSQYFDSL